MRDFREHIGIEAYYATFNCTSIYQFRYMQPSINLLLYCTGNEERGCHRFLTPSQKHLITPKHSRKGKLLPDAERTSDIDDRPLP